MLKNFIVVLIINALLLPEYGADKIIGLERSLNVLIIVVIIFIQNFEEIVWIFSIALRVFVGVIGLGPLFVGKLRLVRFGFVFLHLL